MLKRATIVAGVIAMGLAMGSCTKCGWIWQDWMKPASCNDLVPKQ